MKDKVNILSLSLLTSTQCSKFINEVTALAQADEKVATLQKTLVDALSEANAELNDQIKIMRFDQLTADVEAQDKLRDKCFSSFTGLIRATKHYAPTEAMGLSSKRLNNLLKNYEVKPRMEWVEESKLIIELIDDLSSDEYSGDVKTLGLETWLKSLMHENDEFDRIRLKRQAEAVPTGGRHLKESRRAAETAYRDLVAQVNAHLLIADTADYDALTAQLNRTIESYKQVIAENKRSKTIARKKKDNPDLTPDPTPEPTPDPTPEPDEQTENEQK